MLWLIPRGDRPWPPPLYRDNPHAVVYSSLILEVVGLDQKEVYVGSEAQQKRGVLRIE